ncbi:MAG: molybdate ABC transporter permease subunit [Alphaproteobacteria bacterium]|nr:molybdate ABC transporter permease subunit [Alphaproteobacteria bacterium]
MDVTALRLSVVLAAATVAALVPLAMIVGRVLAFRRFRGRRVVEAALALPLVLPPTVLGFYLLAAFAPDGTLGRMLAAVAIPPLAFTFEGLVVASIIANIPFAVQPIQRGFESIPAELREAAACSGLGPWSTFLQVELPLAWPGIVSATALVFAHTLGEFGVVLMVGGSIPGETRTASIAIYDRMQAFDTAGAGILAVTLLAVSMVALAVVHGLAGRRGTGHG